MRGIQGFGNALGHSDEVVAASHKRKVNHDGYKTHVGSGMPDHGKADSSGA